MELINIILIIFFGLGAIVFTQSARTYEAGIEALENEQWDVLLLDHDLGCFDSDGREWTGYDVMCWLEEHPECLPTCDIRVVSSNPAGRTRMEVVINKLYGQQR